MKVQQFTVLGEFPRFNVLIGRGSRWIYTAAKRKWSTIIQQSILAAKIKPVERAYFRFCWMEASKRADPDNLAGIGRKFILDALVQAGKLPDDGWDEVLGWEDTWKVSPQPGVLVVMEER